MNVYSTNHPIIANTGEYTRNRKIVSIHSEDRNMLKYQIASQFEIEMPEELTNVESIRLVSWSFPSNYDVFSISNKNLVFTFKFTSVDTINNPGTGPFPDVYQNTLPEVYTILTDNITHEYVVNINPGTYSPTQLVMELQNQMNQAVETFVYNAMVQSGYANKDDFLAGSALYPGGYYGFSVTFNEVSGHIWFGNNIGQFTMTNTSQYINQALEAIYCTFKSSPDFSNFGLPSYIGFNRADYTANQATSPADYRLNYLNYRVPVSNGGAGDWIYPSDLWGGEVYYIKCPKKINLMGYSHIYMELAGLNNLDETYPYNVSTFTTPTNQTNGRVNSAFAKIPVPGLPLSMWFDSTVDNNYKFFDPPAERIHRLNVTIRYHNGMLANFENFNFTFCLEFTLLNGYISSKYNMRR